ncbi:Procathepsin L [Manis javanica]|nr:Procathepsin L [Manis javanica]
MVSKSLSSHSRNGAVAHTTTCALRRWRLFVDLHFWARKREDTDACNYKPRFAAANNPGFVDVPQREKALTKAVAAVGPISVASNASHESFQFYQAGLCFKIRYFDLVILSSILPVA